MSKKIKKKESVKEEKVFFDQIPKNYRDLIAVILILIPLLYFFLPFSINNVAPTGNDVLSNIGQTNNWVGWNEKTGELVQIYRIKGTLVQPRLYESGTFTVMIGEEDKEVAITGLNTRVGGNEEKIAVEI